MKEVLSVLVLMHPMNHKGCFEILFSTDHEHFSSVDGNSPEYFKMCGLTTACRFEVTPMQYYKLLGKALAEKLKTLDLHLRYKDKYEVIDMLQRTAKKVVNAQCKYSEDLDIPEIVHTTASTARILPI